MKIIVNKVCIETLHNLKVTYFQPIDSSPAAIYNIFAEIV